MNRGFAAAVGAFGLWGLFPLYWKLLDHVPALEIMAHRLIWCFSFVFIWLALARGRGWLKPILADRRLLGMLCASSAIIGGNWFVYIWGVNNGHIVETSLGYFINPLVNVVLAVVLLGERLNRAQWLAVAIAAVGVAWMTVQFGKPPWIALTLAISFAGYGLLRKLAAVDSVPGLAVESGILLLPALLFLLWIGDSGSFTRVDSATDSFLLLAGPVTALPLILFAYGARRIPFATVGILQYIAPSLQLICGVFVFHEAFTQVHLVGFGCIWLALAIYAADGLLRLRKLQ